MRQLSVGFAFFPYGGTSSSANEVPDIKHWYNKTVAKIISDPAYRDRISGCQGQDFVGTPAYMVRNQAMEWALKEKIDLLIMVDSDMRPDTMLLPHPYYDRPIDPHAKPFFESTFDWMYEKWDEGPHIVAAPYCGGPHREGVYAMLWGTKGNEELNPWMPPSIRKVSREHACYMRGITATHGMPTGAMMIDMRVVQFLKSPYFYYEHNEKYTSLLSTEDIVFTRNATLMAIVEGDLKHDVLLCNWDAWWGHWKTMLVEKPMPFTPKDMVNLMVNANSNGPRDSQLVNFEEIKAKYVSTLK